MIVWVIGYWSTSVSPMSRIDEQEAQRTLEILEELGEMEEELNAMQASA